MFSLRRTALLQIFGPGLLVILAILVVILVNLASNPPGPQIFTDVSWPNCNKTIPADFTQWGIVGVSGGLDYRQNPCLATEAHWFTHYGLYVNTGYPGLAATKQLSLAPKSCAQDDLLCFAYNYGYQATVYDIRYAASQGLVSPLWQLDVETDNSWTTNPLLNRASLQGTIDAINNLTFKPTIGIYSAPDQWTAIASNWRPTVPAWLGTGFTTQAMAVSACHEPSFTAGSIWLTQYTPYLDEDYVCHTLPLWQIGE